MKSKVLIALELLIIGVSIALVWVVLLTLVAVHG